MSYLDKMNKYALDFKLKCLDKDFDELDILINKLKPLLTKKIEFETDDTISNTFLIINKATLSKNEKITYTNETLFQIENIRNSMIDKIVEIQRRELPDEAT
jgi:hypothetical protein